MSNMSKEEIRFFRGQISHYREKARRDREAKELQEILEDMWREEWEDSFAHDPTIPLTCPPTKRSTYSR